MKEETTNPEKLLSPKTSVIIRTRLRAQTAGLYDKSIEEAIINTLVKLKASCLQNRTLKQIENRIRNLVKRKNF